MSRHGARSANGSYSRGQGSSQHSGLGLACVKGARWVGGGLGFSWFGRSSRGHGGAGPGTNRRRPMTRGGVRPEAIVAVIKLALEAAGWVTGQATGIVGPMPLRRVHHAADLTLCGGAD